MSIQQSIQATLEQEIAPEHLEVINESHGHNVPAGSESHFKVVIVADKFEGIAKVRRHQLIYQHLSSYLNNGVHALALHTYTPSEWHARTAAPDSPACMGGSKS